MDPAFVFIQQGEKRGERYRGIHRRQHAAGKQTRGMPVAVRKRMDAEEQKVELFINNEYMGLYSLSYNPDIKIRPRN